jgi:hypothetical protein
MVSLSSLVDRVESADAKDCIWAPLVVMVLCFASRFLLVGSGANRNIISSSQREKDGQPHQCMPTEEEEEVTSN